MAIDDGSCPWPGADLAYRAYHDTEWGRPVHEDTRLFEKLCLEGFQSGLSWITILRKREAFREVFAGFDIDSVAAFGEADVQRLLADTRIVRHRGKIEAAITNAGVVREIIDDVGSLDAFIWRFAPTHHPRPSSVDQVPAQTTESKALARELKSRGARFVGPTTAYAFMQSMGLVNDHVRGCPVGDALG